MCLKEPSQEINIYWKSNNYKNPSLETSQTSLLFHWFILPSVHLSFDIEQSNESMSQAAFETVIRVMVGFLQLTSGLKLPFLGSGEGYQV